MSMETNGLAAIACAAGVILAGCVAPGELTRHYVINAPEQSETVRPASAQEGPIIAVRPVTMPEYLKHNGIVTRDRDNEIERAEFHVWAAPLSEEIARAVAENLSAMLSTDRVTISAARRSIPIDYTVDIEVVNFERGVDSDAVDLLARWIVFRGDERSMLAMRRSRFARPVAGPDYRDTVAAMSAAVTALSEEIAATIDRSRDQRGSDRWAAQRPSRSLSGDAPGARVRRR